MILRWFREGERHRRQAQERRREAQALWAVVEPVAAEIETVRVVLRGLCAAARVPVEPDDLATLERRYSEEVAPQRVSIEEWLREANEKELLAQDLFDAAVSQVNEWAGHREGELERLRKLDRRGAQRSADSDALVASAIEQAQAQGLEPTIANVLWQVELLHDGAGPRRSTVARVLASRHRG